MIYARIENAQAVEYPVTEQEYRNRFPELAEGELVPGWVRLELDPQFRAIPNVYYYAEQAPVPTSDPQVWRRIIVQRPLTEQELAERAELDQRIENSRAQG